MGTLAAFPLGAHSWTIWLGLPMWKEEKKGGSPQEGEVQQAWAAESLLEPAQR